MIYSLRILPLIIISLFSSALFAQKISSENNSVNDRLKPLFKAGKNNEVIKLGKQIHDDSLRIGKRPKPSAAIAFSWVSDAFIVLGQMDSSLYYAQQALSLLHKDSLHHQQALGSVYTTLGRHHLEVGQYDQARKWFKQNLTLKFEANSIEHKKILDPTYGNLGLIYNQLGDHHQGIKYMLESAKLKTEMHGEKYFRLAATYNNIGRAYRNMQQIDTSTFYLKKALQLKKANYGEMHPSLVSTYDNLAINYRDLKDYATTMAYISKIEAILMDAYGDDHPAYTSLYLTKGLTFMEMKQYDKAIENVKKTLACRSKYQGPNHPKNGIQSVLLSKLYLSKKEYSKSKEYLDQAAKILGYDEAQPTNFKNISNPSFLVYYFKYKQVYYKALEERPNNTVAYSDSILQIIDHQLALYDYAESNTILKDDQFLKMERAYPFFESAISNRLLTEEEERHIEAFEIMERSKSRFLFQNFKSLQASHFHGVPDSIITQEKSIQKEIANLETKKFKATRSNKTPTDSLVKALDSEALKLSILKEDLERKVEEQYPDYYQLKHSTNTATLSVIQSTLDQDECIVEYFVGDSSIFIFAIGYNNFAVKEIKKDFPLEEWVHQFRTGIADYWVLSGPSDSLYQKYARSYTENAFLLYQKLVEPIKPFLTERMILIPDGVLHFLPFEALLMNKVKPPTDFRTHPYLLQAHQISYNYSASSRVESIGKSASNAKRDLLAFAPSFPPYPSTTNLQALRSELYELRFNKAEVEMVQSIIPGEIFLENTANKESFLQRSSNYKILHMATHGKANDTEGDYSFLAFSNNGKNMEEENLLYARELYNTSMNTDLVVLSACETGIGELKRGEGMISLARGFTYAGAQSVLASLWAINDQQSIDFFKLFYQNIKIGMPKDEALRQAKLSYIEQSSLPAPYFWSTFVITGNMKPIDLNPRRSIWKWLGFALILMIVFFLGKRIKEKV